MKQLMKIAALLMLAAVVFGFASCKPEVEYVDKKLEDTAPGNVTGLTATAKDSRVLLTWTDATESDVYGYEVSYSGTSAINRVALPAMAERTMMVAPGAGGCWGSDASSDCRVARRQVNLPTPSSHSVDLGFRVVRNIPTN